VCTAWGPRSGNLCTWSWVAFVPAGGVVPGLLVTRPGFILASVGWAIDAGGGRMSAARDVLRLVFAAALLVMVLSGCDWAQLGYGPERTFSSPDNAITSSNASALTGFWTAPYGATDPASSGGRVYVVGSDGTLRALDAANGSVQWSQPTAVTGNSPAVDSGRVFVGADKLYAFDAMTGNANWTVTTNAPVSAPAVVSGVVYVIVGPGTSGAMVAAYRASDGMLLWSTGVTYADQAPAVAQGVVYLDSAAAVVALNATNGAQNWSTSFTPSGSGAQPPAVAGGRVFNENGGVLSAYDAGTGALDWSTDLRPSGSNPPPRFFPRFAVAGDALYVPFEDIGNGGIHNNFANGTIEVVDVATGALRTGTGAGSCQTFTGTVFCPTVLSGVSVAGSLVFATTGNEFGPTAPTYSLSVFDTGTLTSRATIATSGRLADPVVANGVVYLPYGPSLATFHPGP